MEMGLPVGRWEDYAAAADAGALDPESAANRERMEGGYGFPVRVLEVRDGYVLAGSASTETLFPVPFGWTAWDDGRKTFLTSADGAVDLTLGFVMVPRAGSWDAVRDAIWDVAAGGAEKVALEGGMFAVRALDVTGETGPFSMMVVYRPHPHYAEGALRVSLMAPPERFEEHLGLLRLILEGTRGP